MGSSLLVFSFIWSSPSFGRLLNASHSRMLLAEIQAKLRLDPRLEHSGVAPLGRIVIHVLLNTIELRGIVPRQLPFDLLGKTFELAGNRVF